MAVLQIYKRNFSIQELTFIQSDLKISSYLFRRHSRKGPAAGFYQTEIIPSDNALKILLFPQGNRLSRLSYKSIV